MKKEITFSPSDSRDYYFNEIEQVDMNLPGELRRAPYKVRCQWFSSQCVAFACTSAMTMQEKLSFDRGETNVEPHLFSPGVVYANRAEDDYQGEGWYIRKALKQMHNYGVCLEQDFSCPEPYKTERRKFLADKEHLLALMSQYKVRVYFRCQTENEIKTTIAHYGSVIVSAYIPTFLKSKLTKKDWAKRGKHAFIITGWDAQGWICQDSYSIFRPWFGQFHLSYDYPIEEFWGIIL